MTCAPGRYHVLRPYVPNPRRAHVRLPQAQALWEPGVLVVGTNRALQTWVTNVASVLNRPGKRSPHVGQKKHRRCAGRCSRKRLNGDVLWHSQNFPDPHDLCEHPEGVDEGTDFRAGRISPADRNFRGPQAQAPRSAENLHVEGEAVRPKAAE